jgi:hypothetical protein
MVVGVRPHYFGIRLKNIWFLDPTYCKKLRYKFVGRERTCGLHNQDRGVYVNHRRRELSLEDGDFGYLKVSPMRGLRDVSTCETSSCLVSLICSRSWKREKKN